MIGENRNMSKKISNKLFGILLVLSLLFTAGCASVNGGNPTSLGGNPASLEQVDGSKIPTSDYTDAPGNSENDIDPITPEALSDFNLETIQGNIRNIVYADNEKVFILADKLYLYDLETGNVSAETEIDVFDSVNFWTVQNGYVAAGIQMNAGTGSGMMVVSNSNYSCIFYDHNLNKVSEFDLNSLLDDGDMILSVNDMISFSSDGNKIAFTTLSGMYVYDFAGKQKTTIIDLTSEDAEARSGICGFEKIGFTNNDKSIAFLAQSFNLPAVKEQYSFPTYGIVNIDGSGLSNKKSDSIDPKALTVYNNLMLLTEDDLSMTGKVLLMKTPGGEIKTQDLRENNESGFVYGSTSGGYFASALANDTLTEWNLRIYNMETGGFEAEIPISNNGQPLYMALTRIIIIDSTRTCVAAFGVNQSDMETKLISFKF